MNPGDDSTIPSNDKIKGTKPLTVGMVCCFLEANALESTNESIISSKMTEVGGAGVFIPRGTLQMRYLKYSSQSFHGILIFAYTPRGHRLASMQSLLHMTSLSV